MSTPLYLAEGQTKYSVHPVVVFSVLDAFKRRTAGQEYVIGTILGERVGNVVTVKECFPVSHATDNGVLKLNVSHHDTMLSLNRRVNPRLQVLGWFSTAERTDAAWTQINSEYAHLAGGASPLILAVNTSLRKDALDVALYQGKKIAFGETVLHVRFEALPFSYVSDEATRVGIDALINGVPDSDRFDAPSAIVGDETALLTSLTSLRDLLAKAGVYLGDVLSGKVAPNAEVGRALAATLAAVPQLDRSAWERSYGVVAAPAGAAVSAADTAMQAVTTAASPSASMQDLLLMVYLAKVASTQVGLADRVSELLQ